MTLNHFKINFPEVYQQYATSVYALQKEKKLLSRIRDFLYTKGIEIALTPDENEVCYFPTITFKEKKPRKRFDEYKFKSIDKALSYGVESAIAYLETGFYN
ncbi:MAG: hypothetical protein EOO07_07385 [Chitinophagaceae bacterium]|nr:MAG: hypothetical protein EOO07_07385 [Chitinophagaceae bacterium]